MKYLFILLTIFPFFLQSQVAIEYERVFELEGDSEALFKKARNWVNDQYIDANSGLTIVDEESMYIAGKGAIRFNTRKVFIGNLATDGIIRYKLDLNFKDDKVKLRLYSFSHEGTNTGENGGIHLGKIYDGKLCTNQVNISQEWRLKVCSEINSAIDVHQEKLFDKFQEDMSKKAVLEEW